MSSSSTNTLGKYRIVREIARSNDIVYEAVDPSIDRRIALKELAIPPNLQGAQRRERIERFWREGKAAGRLSHPNIVSIFEVGKDGDRHFIAMEFLEGQNLREVLQAGGPLPLKDAVDYALQLCFALAYAHANGVIHRDIKPENVQILPGGHVKLTDFGIARVVGEPSITQDGQVFGTPSYMSPEQVAGKELDARSDIFSLGVVLYEMIAGHKPFAGDGVVTITYNIMNTEPPPPPGAPPHIAAIIRRAMAKDPNMRYASVEDMAADLRDRPVGDQGVPDPAAGAAFPSPFGGAQQGPLTPYGTPIPSPDPGYPGGQGAPDPFSTSPPPAPVPAPLPPRPVLSSETRNFLGVFLLVIGVAAMVIFAGWAINLAYRSFVTAQSSESAQRYYEQGARLYESGRNADAIEQWRHAIRVAPESKIAEQAKERIYAVSVQVARAFAEQRNAQALESQARTLIEAQPNRPEGHFYLAVSRAYQGDLETAKREYELAIVHGGNDEYAAAARRYLGDIYLHEGDRYRNAGDKDRAIAAYRKVVELGGSDLLADAQQRIAELEAAR